MRQPGESGFDDGDWESGTLLAGLEEMDETSLRMEMKTSIDIHRLMRSRQKVRGALGLERRVLSFDAFFFCVCLCVFCLFFVGRHDGCGSIAMFWKPSRLENSFTLSLVLALHCAVVVFAVLVV